MSERMSLQQFKEAFPGGLPVKTATKRKKGARPTNVDALKAGVPEPEKEKRLKYNNKKSLVDDIKFDSQSEADRYTELCILMRLGEIENLKLQPKYMLAKGVYLEGEDRLKKDLLYVADFTYYCKKRKKQIIEDVKSQVTAKCKVYRIKKHLMKAYLGLDVIEIRSSQEQYA